MGRPVDQWTVDEVLKGLETEFGGVSVDLKRKIEENAVDGAFLSVLTDEDLKNELGCTPIQIRKIRKMIRGSNEPSEPPAKNAEVASYDIPPPLNVQPPAAFQPGTGPPPAGYPSGVPVYGSPQPPPVGYQHTSYGVGQAPGMTPAYGMAQPAPQPLPESYGVGMPPAMYYPPPNYQAAQSPYMANNNNNNGMSSQGCGCSIM